MGRDSKKQSIRPSFVGQFGKAFDKVLDNAATSRRRDDSLFSKFPEKRVRHATRSRNIIDGTPVDLEGANIQMKMTLTDEAVRSTDPDALAVALHEMTTEMLRQQADMFFKGFEAITEATGMNSDLKGRKLDPDVILDQYERMDIGFDEEDKPVLPELHVGEDLWDRLREQTWTPAQLKRRDDILEAKRVEHIARKRFRKLYPPTKD